MAFYVVSHRVNDFAAWKEVYDAFEPARRRHGVKEIYALQSVEDPKHVTVVGEGGLEAIQGFLDSDELRSGMKQAGIAGSPAIFIGENKK